MGRVLGVDWIWGLGEWRPPDLSGLWGFWLFSPRGPRFCPSASTLAPTSGSPLSLCFSVSPPSRPPLGGCLSLFLPGSLCFPLPPSRSSPFPSPWPPLSSSRSSLSLPVYKYIYLHTLCLWISLSLYLSISVALMLFLTLSVPPAPSLSDSILSVSLWSLLVPSSQSLLLPVLGLASLILTPQSPSLSLLVSLSVSLCAPPVSVPEPQPSRALP